MGEFRISHVRITFGLVRWRDEKAGTRVVGWSPRFFFFGWRWGGASPHPTPQHLDDLGRHLHLTLPMLQTPHLTPHRRGCPRRALFRVLGHPKVFALLLPKNASYDLLRAPRGIPAISCRRQGECGARGSLPFPISTSPCSKHPISPHIDEDALEGLYFAF